MKIGDSRAFKVNRRFCNQVNGRTDYCAGTCRTLLNELLSTTVNSCIRNGGRRCSGGYLGVAWVDIQVWNVYSVIKVL